MSLRVVECVPLCPEWEKTHFGDDFLLTCVLIYTKTNMIVHVLNHSVGSLTYRYSPIVRFRSLQHQIINIELCCQSSAAFFAKLLRNSHFVVVSSSKLFPRVTNSYISMT